MPKQFAFDQVFRNCSAVDLDKRLIFAQALRVDGVRHQFFTGAGLTIDQNASVGRRHEPDLLAQCFHRDAVANDHVFRLELFAKIAIFMAQPSILDRILYQDERFLQREWLFREIGGAQLRGPYCRLDRSVPGDHDDFGRIL